MASVSPVTKSNLVLQATIAPSTAGLRTRCLPTRYRRPQQIREFRIGLWSSYLDPAFQKELQRRHRVIKHKYADAVNRKLAWDRHRPVYTSRWSLKGLMCSTWRSQDPKPGGRWVNVDELKEVSSDTGVANCRGIEDVEQNALDNLLGRWDVHKVNYGDGSFSRSWSMAHTDSSWIKLRKSHEADVHDRSTSEKQFKAVSPATSEHEYDIDPITNKKVVRNSTKRPAVSPGEADPTSTEIPVKKSMGYGSHFDRFYPPDGNVGGNTIHLDGPSTSSVTASVSKRSQNLRDDSGHYKLFKYNEPDGKPSKPQNTVDSSLRDFDHPYMPFKCNEPDGELLGPQEAVTERLRDYDQQYKPFKYNEPNGQFAKNVDSVSAGLSDFDHEYEPFKYNKPDVKQPEVSDAVEKGLKEYKERITSGSFEKALTINTPQSKPQSAKCWLSLEGFSSETVLQSDRNENINCKASPLRSSYSGLTKFNIPVAEEDDDLDLLRASDIRAASGIMRRPGKEAKIEKDARRTHLEANFDQSFVPEVSSADEVGTREKSEEIRQQVQDLEIKRSELLNLNAHARGRVTAKIDEIDADLNGPKARSDTSRNVTGNFVRDFPEEFSASWTNEGSSTNDCLVPKKDTDAWRYDNSPRGLELSYQEEMENKVQSAENDYIADTTTSADRPSHRKWPIKFETALQRSIRASGTKAKAECDPYSKEPKGLEMSYTEDVSHQHECPPKPFVSSYRCHDQASGDTVTQSEQGSKEGSSKEIIIEEVKGLSKDDKTLVREIRDIYESSYGIIECKHRQPTTVGTKPTGLPKSAELEPSQTLRENVSEAQIQNVPEHLIDKPTCIDTRNAQVLAAENPQSPPPTVYKILAYDPIMQVIEIAEAASIVVDTSLALTPAEVLIRLSNPAKFFPHFQPLQSQGYEIISGSGDVLVFRKVRDGAPSPKRPPLQKPSSDPRPQSRKVVNPIDGMQSIPQPATGNFASPTGFVNHDLPSEHPFISGIDVRREEPVFSGRRTEWSDGDNGKDPARKSKRTTRGLLVGAAWVAACSYAIGVVAEFFRTGGSDGRGPVGF